MREESLRHFICPYCRRGLVLGTAAGNGRQQIEEASLICGAGQHEFQISQCIPRFQSPDNITNSFGFEWNKHPSTQFDSRNGMRLSEERFFRQTNWPLDLSGQTVLEVGSGAGRFTEIAVKTGALVFSVDASAAVDANWNNNGHHKNLILCQASLYTLPFPEDYFDKVFCFGVLQHTPDVSMAFRTIARFVRPGGELVVDVYNKNYWRNYRSPIYLLRPITKRMHHDKLYRLVSSWVPRLIPLSTWVRDAIGGRAAALIPIANYDGLLPTQSREIIEQYSILDTFDTLSPEFILPQRPSTVRQWFLNAGYENIEHDNAPVFAMRGKRKVN